ncbi:MAG: glutaredoxin family protein [Desulfobacterales bacterium]
MKRLALASLLLAWLLAAPSEWAPAGETVAEPPLAPTHDSSATPEIRVEIFSSPTCKYCVMAKAYFREKGVPYVDYNVNRDGVAAARMAPINPRGILPLVMIDGKAVIGFMPEVYDRLLADSGWQP